MSKTALNEAAPTFAPGMHARPADGDHLAQCVALPRGQCSVESAWVDPVIGLGIAAAAAWEGVESWRGEGCEC